jgi:hypothetical protein
VAREESVVAEFERVEAAAESALELLADAVVRTLGEAGLTTSRSDGPGFEVEVDLGADEAGGVFVSWRASDELEDQAADAVLAGRLDHPLLAYLGTVAAAMRW